MTTVLARNLWSRGGPRGPGADWTRPHPGGGITLKVSRYSTVLVPAYSLLKQQQLQLAQAFVIWSFFVTIRFFVMFSLQFLVKPNQSQQHLLRVGAGSHRAHSGVVSAPGRLHAVPAADLGAFPWAPDWQSGAGPSWSLAPAATCAVSKKIATGIEFLPVFLGGMIFLQGDWLFGHPWYLCWSVER